MASKSMRDDESADPSTSETLAELQARQTALIRKGKDLMRELDELTARITQHQANRRDAATRWNKAEGG